MDTNTFVGITIWLAIICCTAISIARSKYSQPRFKNCTVNVVNMEKGEVDELLGVKSRPASGSNQ